jgi:hypothetical protein
MLSNIDKKERCACDSARNKKRRKNERTGKRKKRDKVIRSKKDKIDPRKRKKKYSYCSS